MVLKHRRFQQISLTWKCKRTFWWNVEKSMNRPAAIPGFVHNNIFGEHRNISKVTITCFNTIANKSTLLDSEVMLSKRQGAHTQLLSSNSLSLAWCAEMLESVSHKYIGVHCLLTEGPHIGFKKLFLYRKCITFTLICMVFLKI